jgi:hypothetical protein
MNGIVHGGWPFVFSAYIVTALVLGGYAARAIILHTIGKRLARYERP